MRNLNPLVGIGIFAPSAILFADRRKNAVNIAFKILRFYLSNAFEVAAAG
jgi:hypothetical protein